MENKENKKENFYKLISTILAILLIISLYYNFTQNNKIKKLEKGGEKTVILNSKGEVQAKLEGIKDSLEKSAEALKTKTDKITKLEKDLKQKTEENNTLKRLQKSNISKKETKTEISGKTKTIVKYIKTPVYTVGYKNYLKEKIETQKLIKKYNLQNKTKKEILEEMLKTLKELEKK